MALRVNLQSLGRGSWDFSQHFAVFRSFATTVKRLVTHSKSHDIYARSESAREQRISVY